MERGKSSKETGKWLDIVEFVETDMIVRESSKGAGNWHGINGFVETESAGSPVVWVEGRRREREWGICEEASGKREAILKGGE